MSLPLRQIARPVVVVPLPASFGSPAILGPAGSYLWLPGGSEDPWLCVADFDQVCLYRP